VKKLKWVMIICLVLTLIFTLASGGCTAPAQQEEEEEEEEEDRILQIGYPMDASGNLGCPSEVMDGHAYLLAQTCLESLVRIDEEGLVTEGLATDWELDASAKSITFALRQGVKFHDGADWNAEAAKWNLDQHLTSNTSTIGPNIASVDIVDTYTVVVNLNSWDSTLLDQMGSSYLGFMISPLSAEANGDDWCKLNPVGTGPFKFVSWEPTVKQVYEKFDDYWQEGKPALDGVEWIFIADPLTRTLALEAGEVDMIGEVDPTQAKMLETKGTYTMTMSPTAFIGIAGDSKNPSSPFSDIRVRQAVEYAIDKEAICNSVGQGYWVPVWKQARPGTWADDPTVVGLTYNPTKAMELLDEAGYSEGLDITLYVANLAPYADLLLAVDGYLAAVGINTVIDLYDSAGYLSIVFGGWQNGLTGVACTTLDETSSLFRTYGPPSNMVWPSRESLPAVEALLFGAMAAPDLETKQELTRQAISETVPEAVNIMIMLTQGIGASRQDVHHDIYVNQAAALQWNPADAWIG
jgi:peptide/nickel transport system substrate-binding protein